MRAFCRDRPMVMPGRRQLPAYSPVSARSVAAAVRALFAPDSPRGELRTLLGDAFGARDAWLVDSGTSALRMALEAVREAGRTPVALPAYSCYDVATAAVGAEVPVLFYDVDPAALGPDSESLGAALEAGAGSVVIAHLYGVPVDLAEVMVMTREMDALLIEDAAQGVGAAFDGRPLGSHGSLAVLSFGRGKGWTGGGGGAVLANDEAGVESLEGMSGPTSTSAAEGHGAERLDCGGASEGAAAIVRLAAQWLFGRPALYGVAASLPLLRLGDTVYRPPWHPAAMSGACAAAILASRPAVRSESAARAKRGLELARVVDGLETPALHRVRLPRSASAGYLRFPVVASSAAGREAMLDKASLRLGISPGYPRPLHHLPPMRRRCVSEPEGMPGAEALSDQLLTLPTHGLLDRDDRRSIEGWVRRSARDRADFGKWDA